MEREAEGGAPLLDALSRNLRKMGDVSGACENSDGFPKIDETNRLTMLASNLPFLANLANRLVLLPCVGSCTRAKKAMVVEVAAGKC